MPFFTMMKWRLGDFGSAQPPEGEAEVQALTKVIFGH